MAIIMKRAPMPETQVNTSPRKRVEIATATTISVNSTTAEVTGEMCSNPFSHR